MSATHAQTTEAGVALHLQAQALTDRARAQRMAVFDQAIVTVDALVTANPHGVTREQLEQSTGLESHRLSKVMELLGLRARTVRGPNGGTLRLWCAG